MTITSRKWQRDCSDLALKKYRGGEKGSSDIFVVEAVTGAGKSNVAALTAVALMKEGLIDKVVAMSPMDGTRAGWQRTFEQFKVNGERLNVVDSAEPAVDANIIVCTYGSTNVAQALNKSPTYKGIFFIVDEYHHAEEDQTWGNSVALVQDLATYSMFLSGTPWRRSGLISGLEDKTNIKGDYYYVEGSTKVKADFVYRYEDDLRADDVDRGTCIVNFDFLESTIYDKKNIEKKISELKVIDFPALKAENEQKYMDMCETCEKDTSRLGFHVEAKDSNLTGSKTLKKLLDMGIKRLQESRKTTENICGVKDLTVMLVVAKTIDEARRIEDYMKAAYVDYGFTFNTVVGYKKGDTTPRESNSREYLESIRKKCAENSPQKPDVIISVGMISEGVDIPQIKVVVYASAILTVLYFIQVVGRAMRRIYLKSRERYADKDQLYRGTKAYVIAPAHPKLMVIAHKIEAQIPADAGAQGSRRESSKKLDPPKEFDAPPEYEQDTSEETISYERGKTVDYEWERIVNVITNHEEAENCAANSAWCSWVVGMGMNNSEVSVKRALNQIKTMCDCLDIEYESLIDKSNSKSAEVELTYAQECKLVKLEAQRIANKLRQTMARHIKDDREAFKFIRGQINRAVGIRAFAEATLEQKKLWIKIGNDLVRRYSEVSSEL